MVIFFVSEYIGPAPPTFFSLVVVSTTGTTWVFSCRMLHCIHQVVTNYCMSVWSCVLDQ